MNSSNIPSKKPLVIYHADCADGFGAAWAFHHVFGDRCDYVKGYYNQPAPDVMGREVFMVDFSYKRKVVQEMLMFAESITIIDHHKSAIMDLAELPGLQQYVDTSKSGAVLAWEYLQEKYFLDEPTPKLLTHLQDRDLWKFQIPGTREVYLGLMSYQMKFEFWDIVVKGGQEALDTLGAEGEVILRQQATEVAQIISICKRTIYIAGYMVPVVTAPHHLASEIGAVMSKDQPFSASYYDVEDGRVFSLRSQKEVGVDVSAIAFQYGGGGHPNAAGFKVDRGHPLACV